MGVSYSVFIIWHPQILTRVGEDMENWTPHTLLGGNVKFSLDSILAVHLTVKHRVPI